MSSRPSAGHIEKGAESGSIWNIGVGRFLRVLLRFNEFRYKKSGRGGSLSSATSSNRSSALDPPLSPKAKANPNDGATTENENCRRQRGDDA